MSAEKDTKTGYVVVKRLLDPYAMQSEVNYFDEMVEIDVYEIEKEIKATRIIKKLAILALFLFPIEWPYLRLIVGKKEANIKLEQFQLYRDILFNKITYVDFMNKFYSVGRNI